MLRTRIHRPTVKICNPQARSNLPGLRDSSAKARLLANHIIPKRAVTEALHDPWKNVRIQISYRSILVSPDFKYPLISPHATASFEIPFLSISILFFIGTLAIYEYGNMVL